VTGTGGDKVRKMERFLEGSGGREGKEKERSGSLGNIEELWKRKREEMERSREGEEDIFRSSKKTDR